MLLDYCSPDTAYYTLQQKLTRNWKNAEKDPSFQSEEIKVTLTALKVKSGFFLSLQNWKLYFNDWEIYVNQIEKFASHALYSI